jgi:hypothetical protein
MVMALEKFRLRKVDARWMHGGERGEDWCSCSGYARSFIRSSIEPERSPRNGTHEGEESVWEMVAIRVRLTTIQPWKKRTLSFCANA